MRTVDAQPVYLGVYIEALCPDCKDFIKKQLWPTWQKLSNYINLTIVPYGNGQVCIDCFILRYTLLQQNKYQSSV